MSDSQRTAWATFLAEAVARPGWSVARLARDAGLNRSTIFRWLRGDGGLNVQSVRAIAAALDVDIATAMLAAGAVLGPPSTEDDPEMRIIVESNLPQAKKDALIAHIRGRRARDLEQTRLMVELGET